MVCLKFITSACACVKAQVWAWILFLCWQMARRAIQLERKRRRRRKRKAVSDNSYLLAVWKDVYGVHILLFSFSQSSNRSSIYSHLWALSQWSLCQGPGMWISTLAGWVRITCAYRRSLKPVVEKTSLWMCFISFADVVLHGGRPTRRRSFWIRLMRTCGMNSDRLPRPTGRSGSTSWAGSSRGWPWSRSGERKHPCALLIGSWRCGHSLNII